MKHLTILLSLLLVAPVLAAQSRPGEARDWEHETSDVPVDPRIQFGEFDNGLRYAWVANSEPQHRVYVRLHVNVGSLAEEDSERGMAHFLEHMAFNGSENFPAGTLIEWFQAHGMDFGADTNAHTAFSETVYKLDLPNSDEATLRDGMRVLRDFATELTLSEMEVQAEKGVIDGEERERDSAGMRVLEQQLELMFEGSRYKDRLPIGTKEARDAFDAESVAAFYERWYRPENMTLVVVGDLGDLDPTDLIREHFADIPAPPTRPALEPEPGAPDAYDHFFSIYEEEIPTVQLTLSKLKAWEEEPFTVAEWTEDLPLGYARRMLNLRFSELAKEEGAPFLSAFAGSAEILEAFEGESLSISCQPEKWQESLAVCEQELRRALAFGFQQAELDEVRANALRGLDEAVEREKTRSSLSIMAELLAATEERTVPTNAETDRSILRPAIEALTVEACHEALVKAWGEGELSLTTVGKLDLGEDAAERLRAALESSREVEVEAPEEVAAASFAYASTAAKKGEIVERDHVDDLDFHRVRFANGVAVNIKQTDFKEEQILIGGRLGEGGLSLPPEDSELSMVATQVFDQSGLGAHSQDELRRLLAGKQVQGSFGVAEDHFAVSGATTSEDLLLQCELLCAYLTDPGWREDGMRQFQKFVPQLYEGLKHQHQGPLVMDFLPKIYGGDLRFGLAAQEELEAVDQGRLREWIAPHLAAAPLELTFVGDLEVEEVVEACARTFGVLPDRRGARRYEENRRVAAARTGLREDHVIDTKIPKTLVMVMFPTTDGIDAERRRRLAMLGRIVDDRVRLDIRERLGAAYSPYATAESSEVFPGMGSVTITAMADPEQVGVLVEGCLEVAKVLSTAGVSQDELDRMREPLLKQLRDARRQNSFWLQALSQAQSRPDLLDDARNLIAHYESMTVEDLTPLAKQYLSPEKANVLVVAPEEW